ncbi:MAG: DUF362 domain-containing protein [Opitutales bacterium]
MTLRLRLILSAALLATLVTSASGARAAAVQGADDTGGDRASRVLDTVWEAALDSGFSDKAYSEAVDALFRAYERETGRPLEPGEHRRAGLKLYTASGPGLRTPFGLVRATVEALQRRGFTREELFLLGQEYRELQTCGYISFVYEERPRFAGVRVLALDRLPNAFEEPWYYASNLPSRDASLQIATPERLEAAEDSEDRRSYLPRLLLRDRVDFWINLPMGTDSRALGVAGALANATIWAVSNHRRFLRSPANAPVAAAEIAAIPEYREPWVFSLLSLERYQYIDGFRFNAHYTVREPRLWLSTSPVALDALLWSKMVPPKRQQRFPVEEETPRVLIYGNSVGLGPYKLDEIKVEPVP